MKLYIKHFKELSTEDLYKIYKARMEVFIVEQNCPYQDIDNIDTLSYHIWLEDDNKALLAYCRAIPKGVSYKEYASIGRVICLKRKCGYGTIVVKEAIKVIEDKFKTDQIEIGAQEYAQPFYENIGFVKVSNPYIEDGIQHIKMILKK